MSSGVEALTRAFAESDRRLVVVDRGLRQTLGIWTLSTSIPVAEIIEHFDSQSFLWVNDTCLQIPLHEEESAELTGEYIEYWADQSPPSVAFFDFSYGQRNHISIDEFAASYLAWRTRFWHPEFEPSEPPSFIQRTATETSATATSNTEARSPIRSGSGDTIFVEMRERLNKERQREREKRQTAFRELDFREYKAKFGGVGPLKSKGRHHDEALGQVCTLAVRTEEWADTAERISDTHAVTPGMEVLVAAQGNPPGFPVKAKVEAVDDDNIDLGIYWDSSTDKAKAERAFTAESKFSFRLGVLLEPEYFDHQEAAIETIENDPAKAGILRGEAEGDFTEHDPSSEVSQILNEYQKTAIARATQTDSIYCIHGPPATGKTRTLSKLARKLHEEANRVLVIAPTPTALDELIFGPSSPDRRAPNSLHDAAAEGEFTLSRHANNSPHPVDSSIYDEVDAWKADLVAATTTKAAQFATNEFDWAVLDQAHTATIPESLIPYAKADRLVLAGDHQQLPPRAAGEGGKEASFEPSLFEYLFNCYGAEFKTLLRKQYRMNEKIAEFPSSAFYEGKLLHGTRNRRWAIRELLPLEAVDVSGNEYETPSGSYYNESEIAAVTDEVRRVLDRGTKASEIGIITPYSGQAGKTQVALEEITREADQIKIGTIDAFRNDERDAIVVSFVRSNETNDAGYLSHSPVGARRLNVALTRAKRRCVLIGDWDTLVGSSKETEQAQEHQHFTYLYEYLGNEDLFTTMNEFQMRSSDHQGSNGR